MPDDLSTDPDVIVDHGPTYGLRKHGPFYVNAYNVTRHWGGAEEGGWWFDAGEPVTGYGPYTDHADATEVYGHQEAFAEAINNNRTSIYSVLGHDGNWEVRIESHEAKDWPDETPHYCEEQK